MMKSSGDPALGARLEKIQVACVLAFTVALPLSGFFSEAFYAIGLIAWAARKTLARCWALPSTPLNDVLLAWLLVVLASCVNSVDLGASATGIRKLLKHFSFYFVVVETMATPRVFRQALLGCLAGLAVMSFDGLWQAATGKDLFYGHTPSVLWGNVKRITATLHHPNDFAIYLTALCPLMLVASQWKTEPRVRRMAVVGLLATLAALVLAFSRGGTLAFVISMGWLAFALRRWLPVGALAALLIAQMLLVPSEVKRWAEDHASWLEKATEPERLMYWGTAMRMIQAHPVIGVGTNTFIKNYPRYKWPEDPYETSPPYAHNMYLHLAAQLGLVGLIVFGVLVLRLLRWLRPAPERAGPLGLMTVARDGLGAGFIAYLVLGLFESSLYYSRQAMLFWLLVSLLVSWKRLPAAPAAQAGLEARGVVE